MKLQYVLLALAITLLFHNPSPAQPPSTDYAGEWRDDDSVDDWHAGTSECQKMLDEIAVRFDKAARAK